MIQVAALPYRNKHGTLEVLVVSSLTTGRWIVPKGWPMKGRKNHQAAKREAYEEAGVRGKILREPIGTFRYGKLKGGMILDCVVEVYALRVKGRRKSWPEKGTRQSKWLPWEEAAEIVDDAGLGEVIREFARRDLPPT